MQEFSDTLRASQAQNLTENRSSMMRYYTEWRDLTSLGRVFLTANFSDQAEVATLRRIQEEFTERHYSVFVPFDFFAAPEDLNYGERSHYISILNRVISELNFMMVVVNDAHNDYLVHVGMAATRKPLITLGTKLPKPFDAIPMLHLNNESEAAKFFDIFDLKSNLSNFNTRLTAVAGHFHQGKD